MQSDLQTILQENLYFLKRRELLQAIETKLATDLGEKVGVAAYIANTLNPGIQAVSSTNLTHIAYVDDLIRGATTEGARTVALIVESFGGEATFPSEVMARARKCCDRFSVVVVNVGKSAATLLSLLGDRIVALETASFGPVDPQLFFTSSQGAQTVSARSISELMESTIPNLVRNMGPVERAAILASQNYALYQQALDALKLVEEVIDRELGPKMNAGQLAQIKKKLVRIPLSHSSNVSIDDLADLGFSTLRVAASSELGNLLIEYHRRALRSLIAEAGGGQGALLFESRKSSFQINVQIMQALNVGRVPRVSELPGQGPQKPPGPAKDGPSTSSPG